ncbi:MAG: hypothetical protein ACRDTN_20720, partial [Mycobacterium sp.]
MLKPGDVRFDVLCVKRGGQELTQPRDDVVFEVALGGDRQNAVGVRSKAGVGSLAVEISDRGAGVDEDQSRLVQAVAAHHDADGVGDQLLGQVAEEQGAVLVLGSCDP